MFAHAGENLCWLDLRFRSQAHAFGAPLCGFGLLGAVEPTFIVPLMKFVEYSRGGPSAGPCLKAKSFTSCGRQSNQRDASGPRALY